MTLPINWRSQASRTMTESSHNGYRRTWRKKRTEWAWPSLTLESLAAGRTPSYSANGSKASSTWSNLSSKKAKLSTPSKVQRKFSRLKKPTKRRYHRQISTCWYRSLTILRSKRLQGKFQSSASSEAFFWRRSSILTFAWSIWFSKTVSLSASSLLRNLPSSAKDKCITRVSRLSRKIKSLRRKTCRLESFFTKSPRLRNEKLL